MTNTDIAVQKNETFCFDSNQVRVLVDQEDTVWFVAKDVAQALGYGDTNQAIRKHCKCAKLLKGVESTGLVVPSRGLTIINRRDVFRLIMRSHLPEAEQFEEWVWDVIETVLDEGGYIKGEESMDEDQLIAKAYETLMSKLKRKELEAEQQRKKLEENQTVQGYVGFHLRKYITHSEKIKLGQTSCAILVEHGKKPQTEYRQVRNKYGDLKETSIRMYPKWALDAAARYLGLNQ